MDKKLIESTRTKVKIHRMINFDQSSSDVKVSIVVPICNVEIFLRECLDSLINQTLKDIEIICVNDGSTDHCMDILNEYSNKDKRIKVVDKDNAGYGHTMNLGMDLAKGEYIGIVESDDFVKLNMFEDLYKVAKQYDLDFVKADFYRFTRENGNLHLFYNILSRKQELYNVVLTAKPDIDLFKFTNTWSGIYKKDFLEKNNIRHQETPGASYQDNGFWFQTTCSAKRFYYIDKPYYMNRRDNPNSSVYNKGKVYAGNSEYKFIYNFMENNGQMKDTFKYIFTVKKFDNYFQNYRRIAEEFKKDYLITISKEFSEAFKNNEVDEKLFSKKNYKNFCDIMNDPIEFYERTHMISDISFSAKLSDENIIPIVLICDNDYVIQTATAISSIIKNKKKNSHYDITIIAVELSDDNIRKFALLKKANIDINIIYVTKENVDNLHPSEITNYGVSTTALIKFELPNLMYHYNKIIYLDGDLIVKRDLTELFSVNLENNYAAVVRDMPQVLYKKQVFGVKYGRDYFNSGVMLLNLDLMRKNNLTEVLISTKRKIESRLMDQDVFNEVFKDKIVQLPIKYNTLFVNLIRSKGKYSLNSINKLFKSNYKTLNDIRKDSAIIHYCSKDKPWKFYDVPAADIWIEYFFRSAYSDVSMKRSSVLDKDHTIVEGNGVYSKEDKKKGYPIVIWIDNVNKNDVLKQIQNINKINNGKVQYDIFLFHNNMQDNINEISSIEYKNISINFINIHQIYYRDSIYLNGIRLNKNYYRILVPEILCQYERVLILDNIDITDDLEYYFTFDMKEKIVGAAQMLNGAFRFWDAAALVIDIRKFILSICKLKFIDAFNGVAKQSYQEAINIAISPEQKFSLSLRGLEIYDYNVKYALNDLKDMVNKSIVLVNRTNSIIETNKLNDSHNIQENIKKYKKENEQLKREIYELKLIKNSTTYKVGRIIMFIPCKIKDFFIQKKKK